jgi:hypothetical protein
VVGAASRALANPGRGRPGQRGSLWGTGRPARGDGTPGDEFGGGRPARDCDPTRAGSAGSRPGGSANQFLGFCGRPCTGGQRDTSRSRTGGCTRRDGWYCTESGVGRRRDLEWRFARGRPYARPGRLDRGGDRTIPRICRPARRYGQVRGRDVRCLAREHLAGQRFAKS